MAARDLINLGVTPDSGTGDTARRGGAKINDLFADIYTNFGDNPIGNDPSGPFYGYRRQFEEFEYKVGELHATGRWQNIRFRTTNTDELIADGGLLDSDGSTAPAGSLRADRFFSRSYSLTAPATNGVPNIYLDSEWYFATRGEQIDVDLTDLSSTGVANIVLPIARRGDVIKVRETRNSLTANRRINIWTTPFRFSTQLQYNDWLQNDEEGALPRRGVTDPYDSDAEIQVAANVTINSTPCPVTKVGSDFVGYPVDFYYNESNSGRIVSPVVLANSQTEYEFIYLGHDLGWISVSRILTDTGELIGIDQDNFTETDWYQLENDIVGDDGTEVTEGYYMLSVTPRIATGPVDIRNVQGHFLMYKVFRQVNASYLITGTGLPSGAANIRDTLVRAIRGDSTANVEDFTDQRSIRFRAALGQYTDAIHGSTNDDYSGFDGGRLLFKEVTVPVIIDQFGNMLIFSAEPFVGRVEIYRAT